MKIMVRKTEILFWMMLCALTLVLMYMLFVSRDASPRSAVVQSTQAQIINLSTATTVGNHTFIPLNITGESSDRAQSILDALNSFEKAHPDWEVTSWSIEERHISYGFDARLYGIWINHRSVR